MREENNDINNLRGSCRVCLEIHSKMKKILDFDKLYDFINYRDMLVSICGIVINGNNQPDNICITCADKVLAAYTLKIQCEKTDIYLRGLQINNISSKDPDSEEPRGFPINCCDCTICGKSFETCDELQKHLKSHNPKKPFHCKVDNCRWSFSSEYELIAHTHVNHSGKDTLECIVCSKLFKNKRCLRQHMLVHRENKRFKCRFCEKGFNFAKHLENHEVTHTKAHPYLCQKCGKAFVTKDRLILHIKRHDGQRVFLCTVCPKRYFSNAELTVHSKTHAYEQRFVCSLCGVSFALKSSLCRHMRNIHIRTPYKCKLCAAVRNGQNEILEHMKAHLQKYSSEHRNQIAVGFETADLLANLVAKPHFNSKSHICKSCYKTFKRAYNLKTHCKKHHPKTPAAKMLEIDSESDQNCNESLTTPKQLMTRMEMHLKFCERATPTFEAKSVGAFPLAVKLPDYFCDICSQAFASNFRLKEHLFKVHTSPLTNDV